MRMKSFSAWTYISNNKLRSTVLVIMMMFTAVCFVGDMYVNNVFDSVKATATIRKSYIEIGIHGSNNDLKKEFWDLTENDGQHSRFVEFTHTRHLHFFVS